MGYSFLGFSQKTPKPYTWNGKALTKKQFEDTARVFFKRFNDSLIKTKEYLEWNLKKKDSLHQQIIIK